MFVDAPQIAAPHRDAVPVEKLEDLDRDLAAVIHLIPEQRGVELSIRRFAGQLRRDLHHLGDGVAQEEVIMRHFIDTAHAAEQLQQPPDLAFRLVDQIGDVAHARRPEPLGPLDQRRDLGPQPLVLRRQPDLVTR